MTSSQSDLVDKIALNERPGLGNINPKATRATAEYTLASSHHVPSVNTTVLHQTILLRADPLHLSSMIHLERVEAAV